MLAAAWVSAGATAGLLIVAVITVWFAFTTWATQLGTLSTQLMQVGLQAKRDAEQRRRAQAAQIFTWVDTETSADDLSPSAPGLVVCVSNSSQQPVYDLAVTLPGGTEGL